MELKDLKDIVINCQTKREAKRCCKLANKLGWKWCNGVSYENETYWNECKSETCYNFKQGGFAESYFYEERNYIIKPASWFLENFKTKDNMEEKETKKGTLAEMYACANDELKKVLESKFSEEELGIEVKLPNTWEEFCENNHKANGEFYIDSSSFIVELGTATCRNTDCDRNFLPSKQSAEAHLALMQLEQLRDCYRQGWFPNWDDESHKYAIHGSRNGYVYHTVTTERHFLTFQSMDICCRFYENFKELIETSKDLI